MLVKDKGLKDAGHIFGTPLRRTGVPQPPIHLAATSKGRMNGEVSADVRGSPQSMEPAMYFVAPILSLFVFFVCFLITD